MPMNRVQFQPSLSLLGFFQRYGTEEQCWEALRRARWPHGFVCPRCEHTGASTFVRGSQQLWQCQRCRAQISLTAGTPLAATKVPLRVWWLAIYLVSQAKNGIAALELSRQLGVCYRTAWRLKHKLMAAMADQEERRQLTGLIQIDDAYLGGERTGGPGEPQWGNKIPFVAAVATHEGRPRRVRFDVLSSFRRSTLQAWAERVVGRGGHIVSDGLTAFTGIAWAGVPHQAIVTGSGKHGVKHPRLHWINTLLSNLKTSLAGTHHALKFGKYASRYLHAHAYRFNRRFHMAAMISQLARTLIRAHPCSEVTLRAPAEIRR
jgi:ribosomal protein L37AE/L43A